MGANESAQRQAQFQRPTPSPASSIIEQDDEEPHISISNKMVERIVEDASVTSKPASLSESMKASRDDYKDLIIMEKLKALDEKHSERWRLRVQDLNAMANRIDRRTEHMMSLEPVCPVSKQAIIDCYENVEASHGDYTKCWDTINAFNNCVKDETYTRLCERTKRDAREHARRCRRVALARENVLKDLSPQATPKKCEFEEATAS